MRRRILALLLGLSLLLCSGAAAPPAFPDLEPGSWYEPVVLSLAEEGLLLGGSDGAFHPLDPISAAEFITVTARCAHLEPVPTQSLHWAAGTLQAALQAGWYDWDELPPTGEGFDRPISRQLAVKVLMRALLPQVRGDYGTQSARIRDFSTLAGRYYEPVLAAYAASVAMGDEAGNFRPLSSLTRAEACALIQRARTQAAGGTSVPAPLPQPEVSGPALPPAVQTIRGGVAEHGWLQVTGTQLCDQTGAAAALRGMSSHGLQWYGRFTSESAIANTAAYGANLFRVAMYTGEGGYLSQPQAMEQQAIQAIEAAIRQDMYVILDWHILSDGNPMSHVEEAESFFTRMAGRYADYPNLLYEICNEPNGGASWTGDIKPYAQRLVAAIRSQSPRAVILIGSSTWSQDLHLAAADPLAGDNLMYTLHFYAGTHGQDLRQRIDDALAAGLPVFVSEWGTSRADGSGGVFLSEAEAWLDFLDSRGISWCNWSLCDKDETSAALRPGTDPEGTWTQEDLTPSGAFVFGRFSR